jgi:hypothetical protein
VSKEREEFKLSDLPQKPKLTANELAGIFSTKLGVPKVRVNVYPAPQIGWDASLIADPRDARVADDLVKELARALRAQYDLKD